MKFRKLGTTDIDVSLICLGTMTWGTQNTEKDAFEQMDYAVSQGINFFDTAELYSVPPNSESYGCLLYTSPSPRDPSISRMPSSA